MAPTFAERQLSTLPAGVPRYAPRLASGPARPVVDLCRAALAAPVEGEPLAVAARDARRVVVVVSDRTRDEPRAEMLEALLEVVDRSRVTAVVATGTHGGARDLAPDDVSGVPVLVHDGASTADTVPMGSTGEGTPVRLSRWLVEADLVVTTGRLRPHYFAGYSGGAKGVFPGCAHRDGILANHELKADPTAELGRVDANRCRKDMEAAAGLLPTPAVALNVLADCDGRPVAAAYGGLVSAHRRLAASAGELFAVRAPEASVVVVADRPPVTRSLYQASKLLAPAAALLRPGGTVVLVAECDQGTGPLERVNDGIYALGLAPRLGNHRVVLVSALHPEVVGRTYATWAPSLLAALDDLECRRPTVLWRAGELVATPLPAGGPC